VARSDRLSIEFGADLTPEEMRWLHAQVLRILAS